MPLFVGRWWHGGGGQKGGTLGLVSTGWGGGRGTYRLGRKLKLCPGVPTEDMGQPTPELLPRHVRNVVREWEHFRRGTGERGTGHAGEEWEVMNMLEVRGLAGHSGGERERKIRGRGLHLCWSPVSGNANRYYDAG